VRLRTQLDDIRRAGRGEQVGDSGGELDLAEGLGGSKAPRPGSPALDFMIASLARL